MARKSYEPDIPRLCQAVQRARLAMRKPREVLREIARHVAGENWSEEGSRKERYINLLSIYQQVVGRTLIPHNPRLMLSTFQKPMRPTINAMQSWANQHLEHIKFDHVARRIVTNALYSFGIAKVSIASPAQSAVAAWNLRAGEANIWNVDLDDFVCDLHARSADEFSFVGHRYRVPLDAVKDSRFYDRGRKQLEASYDPMFNMEGGDERISMLGRTYLEGDGEEFQDMIDLWEIYLPRHRLVLTLAEQHLTGPEPTSHTLRRSGALRTQSWIGPDRGPFHILGYQSIPGNWMPKGPMQDLFTLDLATNRAMRKLVKTIDRIKEITLVTHGADASGTAVMTANDGDMIGVADPGSTQQVVMGGQHAQLLLAMVTSFKDFFSFIGGNIELLGGRGAQSRTATQDKMLDENANAGIQDLQAQTVDFVSDVLKSLCWYWWHDPKKVMKTQHHLPGLPEFNSQMNVHPAGAMNPRTGQPVMLARNGRFEDLQIQVDPYSLQHKSPQERLQTLNQTMQTIVLPLMTLMVQQGKMVDIDAYLQKVAAWTDDPDLADIITISEPPGMGSGGQSGPDKPPMPSNTNREYTRHNVSEETPGQRDQNQIAAMLGHSLGGDNRNGKAQPLGAA